MQIVNESGRANDHVYVMLAGGSSSDGQLKDNVSARLSEIRNRRFSLTNISGRIYFSFDAPVAFNEPNRSPTRYDKVELTYPGVTNLTAVDFFGIPFRLEAKAGDGRRLGSLTYDADTETIKQALLAIPGAWGALVETRSGDFARILSPQLSQSSYPSFDRYIASLSGQTVTVRGSFFGSPFQTFAYSGAFGPDGTITLNGTITPQGGPPATGESLTVAGSTLTSAIYTVDGPYTWGGRERRVSDNDVYAAIYRDLLAGFAWGYWGGRYGNDSGQWQGRPPFAAARTSPADYSTYNEYASVIYEHSDAYGFSFSDTGPKKVQLGLDNAATLQVTILADGSPALGGPGQLRGDLLLRAANVPERNSIIQVRDGTAIVGRAPCPPACGTLELGATQAPGTGKSRSAARRMGAPVKGSAKVSAKGSPVKVSPAKGSRLVARGSARVKRSESRRLAVSLNRPGRKRLRGNGRLRIRLSLGHRSRGDIQGRASRTLVLKR